MKDCAICDQVLHNACRRTPRNFIEDEDERAAVRSTRTYGIIDRDVERSRHRFGITLAPLFNAGTWLYAEPLALFLMLLCYRAGLGAS